MLATDYLWTDLTTSSRYWRICWNIFIRTSCSRLTTRLSVSQRMGRQSCSLSRIEMSRTIRVCQILLSYVSWLFTLSSRPSSLNHMYALKSRKLTALDRFQSVEEKFPFFKKISTKFSHFLIEFQVGKFYDLYQNFFEFLLRICPGFQEYFSKKPTFCKSSSKN